MDRQPSSHAGRQRGRNADRHAAPHHVDPRRDGRSKHGTGHEAGHPEDWRAGRHADGHARSQPVGRSDGKAPGKTDEPPPRGALPGTLERSPAKAQRTWAETFANAEARYGSGERAARTAYAALKHAFEKVGDHWEPKAHPGPSDAQAARSGRDAREHPARTAGGVDAVGHTRAELDERARALGIRGRSSMDKQALAQAIAKRQD